MRRTSELKIRQIRGALRAVAAGVPHREAARSAGCHPSTLSTWKERWGDFTAEELREYFHWKSDIGRFIYADRFLHGVQGMPGEDMMSASLGLLEYYLPYVTQARVERRCGRLLDAMNLARGARLLDLGCGMGHLSLVAARRGYAVTAVDRRPLALMWVAERAEEEGLDVRLLERDIFAGKDCGRFDGVVMSFVRRAEVNVLRHLTSALAPGGTLLVVPATLTEDEVKASGLGLELVEEVAHCERFNVGRRLRAQVYRRGRSSKTAKPMVGGMVGGKI